MRPACATTCPGGAISFGERQAHLRQIEEDGRATVNHDAFLLGPSNIFLQRQTNWVDDVMAGDTINLMDFTATDRQRPAVVDDPTRKETLLSDATAYPYRSKREDRQPDRIVAGGAISVSTVARCIIISRMTSLCALPAMKMTRYGVGKSVQNHNFYCNFITAQNGSRPRLNVGERGEGKFEPISWDQALDEIAAKLQGVKDEFGPESLAIFAGTRTGTLTRRGYIRLFTQLWGTPNFGDTEAFCSEAKRVSFQATLGAGGSGNSYTEGDLGRAALYVYFGDNQAETRPVHFGMINNWRLKNNAKMVVIDPRMTVTATKANQWLAIRPGTDLALALHLPTIFLRVIYMTSGFVKMDCWLARMA